MKAKVKSWSAMIQVARLIALMVVSNAVIIKHCAVWSHLQSTAQPLITMLVLPLAQYLIMNRLRSSLESGKPTGNASPPFFGPLQRKIISSLDHSSISRCGSLFLCGSNVLFVFDHVDYLAELPPCAENPFLDDHVILTNNSISHSKKDRFFRSDTRSAM